MASTKNTTRRKRKYTDARKSVTARNKKRRKTQAEARHAYLIQRTQDLSGKQVAVRNKDHIKPLVGTVLEVIRKDSESYPHEARRHVGAYLRVRTAIGELLSSRHRVKIIKEKSK